jgi:predicted aconitase
LAECFDAEDMVDVSQAHMMADPESLGEAGVAFVENLAETDVKVRVPMITDPRGVDLNYYEPLGQTENMAVLERRFIAACKKMGYNDDEYLHKLSNDHATCFWGSCCVR